MCVCRGGGGGVYGQGLVARGGKGRGVLLKNSCNYYRSHLASVAVDLASRDNAARTGAICMPRFLHRTAPPRPALPYFAFLDCDTTPKKIQQSRFWPRGRGGKGRLSRWVCLSRWIIDHASPAGNGACFWGGEVYLGFSLFNHQTLENASLELAGGGHI